MKEGWFSVDKEGLAKLCERRGKVFVLHELLQNAWDCGDATEVRVELRPVDGKPLARLTVTDDSPEGFKNLSHAYTLFAESEKKGDAGRRGRFNLGEKLVLAMCEEAEVESTRGTVIFGPVGRSEHPRRRRKSGTTFKALVRMTRAELDDCLRKVSEVLPPGKVATFVNGEQVAVRDPVSTIFEAFLETEISGADGYLKRRYRSTSVDLHLVGPGEKATLYEMGIPVMELGDDPFHVNVGQKIPLTMERDSAPPAYVQEIRALVLDKMHKVLTPKGVTGKWVMEAIEGSENPEAVRSLVTKRFGDKVVIADPSDHEGEDIAKSRGYTIIPGGAFTADAWEKIREARAALPAGQVTPSPKPFHPDGDPLALVPSDEWSKEMIRFASFTRAFAARVVDLQFMVDVQFTRDKGWKFNAAYSRKGLSSGRIIFNLGLLGDSFLRDSREQVELLLHELGHHFGGHLESRYHEALTQMAARAVWLAANDESFRSHLHLASR
jgi:hypothetical protein